MEKLQQDLKDLNERVDLHLSFAVADEERIDTLEPQVDKLECELHKLRKELGLAHRTISVMWRVLESRFYYDLYTSDAAVQREEAVPQHRLTMLRDAPHQLFAEPKYTGTATNH